MKVAIFNRCKATKKGSDVSISIFNKEGEQHYAYDNKHDVRYFGKDNCFVAVCQSSKTFARYKKSLPKGTKLFIYGIENFFVSESSFGKHFEGTCHRGKEGEKICIEIKEGKFLVSELKDEKPVKKEKEVKHDAVDVPKQDKSAKADKPS